MSDGACQTRNPSVCPAAPQSPVCAHPTDAAVSPAWPRSDLLPQGVSLDPKPTHTVRTYYCDYAI